MGCFPDGCCKIALLMLACALAVCALGTWIAAPILLANGYHELDEANKADPGKDFTNLGQVCNITGVKHCWKTTRERYNYDCDYWGNNCRTRRANTCTDTYVYDFKVQMNTGKNETNEWPSVYQSTKESNRRNGNSDDDESCTDLGGSSDNGCSNDNNDRGNNGPAGSFGWPVSPGGNPLPLVRCWAPQDNMTESSLPSVYKCGSPACVKINNPADDKNRDKNDADGNIIAGWVCLGAGGLSLALAVWVFCCACKGAEKRASARHVPAAVRPPVAMPVATPVDPPAAVPMAHTPMAMPVATPVDPPAAVPVAVTQV